MVHPNIRDYREDKRSRHLAPLHDRLHFLGRNSLDLRWHRYEPKVNIRKTENLYEMEISLPGFTKKDITVNVNNNILKVIAEKKQEVKASDYILKEFDHDKLERTFKLANNIGKEKVIANFKKGILRISFIDVPKSEEKNRKKVVID